MNSVKLTASDKKTIERTTQSKSFAKQLGHVLKNIPQPLKLILHAGAPKTGTTSLQVYLDKKQGKLRKLGILYPNRSHNLDAPKHQWFEKNLVRTHPQNLLDNLTDIISQVDDNTHTILLSSEGIYNHWWDFPVESKALLFELNQLFDVNLWIWFREPVDFAESFYKQCLRNPTLENIACYGKDLSFAEMLNDPWFLQRLDYEGFINECDSLFGRDAMSVFEYQQDTVKTVSQLLGLSTPHDNPTPRKNQSMNTITAELFRVINRLPLSAKEKEKLIPHLHELDSVISPYLSRATDALINADSKNKINEITSESMKQIQKRYKN